MKEFLNDFAPAIFIFGGLLLFFVLLIGILLWSGQDFANRCERAGGVLVNYSVCITKDSDVLMVGS